MIATGWSTAPLWSKLDEETAGGDVISAVSSVLSSPYAAAVMDDAPLLYWRLGEAGGDTAADGSGNGNHGTFVGSPALSQAGAIAGDAAVSFDGVDDKVTIPSSLVIPAGSSITVEFWQYMQQVN